MAFKLILALRQLYSIVSYTHTNYTAVREDVSDETSIHVMAIKGPDNVATL